MENENGQTPPKADFTGLLNKIKNFLLLHYEPVFHPSEAEFHYTTLEVWDKVQKVFPSSDYSSDEVALWLHEAGFTFYDYGELRFEWMMKRA